MRRQYLSTHLLLGFIVMSGAALRLIALDKKSFWFDEGFSYWVANRPFPKIVSGLAFEDVHPPLYFFMLRLIMPLGRDEFILRLPSALTGIASIVLIYVLAKQAFDTATGLIAALILTVSPIHIWYAQEVRMYTLVSLMMLTSVVFAMRALRTNSTIDWVLVGLFELLALWTNTGAIWFCIALNAFALINMRQLRVERQLTPWLISQAGAALLFLPWFPFFLRQFQTSVESIAWIAPADIGVLGRTAADLVVSYADAPPTDGQIQIEILLALLILGTLFTAAARGYRRDVTERRRPYLFLLCWMLVPFGLTFVISQPYVRFPLISGNSLFLVRNLLFVSFPLYVLMARGLMMVSASLRAVLIVVLIGLNIESYVANINTNDAPWEEDYRSAARIVEAHVEEGDGVILAPRGMKAAFCYYYCDKSASNIPYYMMFSGAILPENDVFAKDIATVLATSQRVWLVSYDDEFFGSDDATVAKVHSVGTQIGTWQVDAIVVSLYRLAP